VRGRRIIPYARFHTGYKKMDLAPDELIVAVRLPRTDGWVQHYRKVGARRAQAISKVCFAARARMDDGHLTEVRLAFGSVAPTVIRAEKTEEALRGHALDESVLDRARAALRAELSPIDDIRSTARYRSQVAVNLLAEFVGQLRER
jgi:CO/xanthine dehydrogenase FAD-binding subunit